MRLARDVTLVLMSGFLGCSAAVIAPMAVSKAAPAAGTWGCYSATGFPNAEESIEMTQGMNTVARHAAPGTVVVIERFGSKVCVKH